MLPSKPTTHKSTTLEIRRVELEKARIGLQRERVGLLRDRVALATKVVLLVTGIIGVVLLLERGQVRRDREVDRPCRSAVVGVGGGLSPTRARLVKRAHSRGTAPGAPR